MQTKADKINTTKNGMIFYVRKFCGFLCLAILTIFVFTNLSFAQEPSSEPSDRITRRANKIFNDLIELVTAKYFDKSNFESSVNITLKEESKENIYLSIIERISNDSSFSRKILTQIETVEVELLFDETIKKEKIEKFVKLLTKKMLENGLSSNIKTGTLPIKKINPTKEMRELKSQLSNKDTELNKNNLEKNSLEQEIKRLKETISEQKTKMQTDLGLKMFEVGPWIATIIISCILIGLFILILASKLFKSSDNLKTGLSSIAGSIETGLSSGTRTSQADTTSAAGGQAGVISGQSSGQSSSQGGDTQNEKSESFSPEFLQNKLSELQGYIKDQNDESYINRITDYVSDLATNSFDTTEIFLTFEFIGAEKAQLIFDKLSKPTQKKLIKSLSRVNIPSNKVHRLVQIGEKIKALNFTQKLFADKEEKNHQISEVLLKCDDRTLLPIIKKLTGNQKTRLLFHTNSEQLRELLTNLFKTDKEQLEEVIEAIKLVPEKGREQDQDKSIIDIMMQTIDEMETSSLSIEEITEYYTDILTPLDDVVKPIVLKQITENNSEMKQHLYKTIIVFDTLLVITEDSFEKIREHLTNRDLAVLTTMTEEPFKSKFESLVTERQKEMLEEEKQDIEKLKQKAKDQLLHTARKNIIEILKSLQKKDDLEFTFDETTDTPNDIDDVA